MHLNIYYFQHMNYLLKYENHILEYKVILTSNSVPWILTPPHTRKITGIAPAGRT